MIPNSGPAPWHDLPTMMHAADYHICVRGPMPASDVELLAGLEIVEVEVADGVTITHLEGHLADQAALVGAINALYARHRPVISVRLVEAPEDTPDESVER